MWETKKSNKTVVVTIQGQVKTVRTKPNDQHLEQVITRNVFKKDSASGVTNEGLGFSPTSSTRTGSFSDLSVFISY